MRKINKSKTGFTLVEVIIVVAVIVILAGVVTLNVSGILGTTKDKNKAVSEDVSELQGVIDSYSQKADRYHF
ncbi:MAG: prepilin-type N-terminal cleavage/methylation domain-containing protein [Clostridiales bacterium]|nr:prepilin-type N-terminal cleavage/methylation domain-containing protein [Clostridiales bacterium]